MHHARISLAFSILFLLIDLAKRPFASVAQLVEQGTENPRVGGSIPPGGTKYADVAHLVERHLAKVEVASSSLVIRSRVTRLRKQSGFALSELAASAAVGPADCAHRSDVVTSLLTAPSRLLSKTQPLRWVVFWESNPAAGIG